MTFAATVAVARRAEIKARIRAMWQALGCSTLAGLDSPMTPIVGGKTYK